MKIATNATTPRDTTLVMVLALAFRINHQTSPTDWRLPAKQLEVTNNLFRILWCSHTMHTVGRNGANQRRHTKCQRGILRPFRWACHLSTAKAHETTMFNAASNAIRIKAACMYDWHNWHRLQIMGRAGALMDSLQPNRATWMRHKHGTQSTIFFRGCCTTCLTSLHVLHFLPCLTALVSSLDTFLPISVSQRPTAFAVIRSCKKCCLSRIQGSVQS